MTVLFICVENRARSQMAEGLARHFLGHKFDVLSAGSSPADQIHPMAVAVMAEIGIDISGQHPKAMRGGAPEEAFAVGQQPLARVGQR